jgi:hypothetical protein
LQSFREREREKERERERKRKREKKRERKKEREKKRRGTFHQQHCGQLITSNIYFTNVSSTATLSYRDIQKDRKRERERYGERR